jgi:hypothetical protein
MGSRSSAGIFEGPLTYLEYQVSFLVQRHHAFTNEGEWFWLTALAHVSGEKL